MSKLLSTLLKRSTLMATSFILAVSSLSAAMPLFLNQNVNAVSNIVVTPSSSNGWFGYDDNGHGGSVDFVNGPATAPLGTGSAQISINATTQGYMLAKSAYGGMKFSAITNLSYDTYVQQGNNTIAPALQFNVTNDVVTNTSWQGRLVYEPYQNGHATVTDGQWESQNALGGLWWFSKPNLFGNNCPQSAPCSLADIISLYPSAGISNGQPLVGFKAGSNWTTFVGNVDNFVINSDTYDFEPNAIPACSADDTTFDTFTTGSVNGQHGWKSTGPFDQAVVDNTYGINSFGCKTLRISNAVTSGSFGNQTFSYASAQNAGESSTGAVNNHFEASFDMASALSTLQPGMSISVSPDDGTGNRMSYLRFEDQPDGIHVFFDDVTNAGPLATSTTWNESLVATLSRTQPHNVKFVIDYNNGPSNDVVHIYIDSALVAMGTTWENYYRYDTEQSGSGNIVPSTDRLLFRTAGPAASANNGNGFLFDNVSISTSNVIPASPINPRWLNHVGDTLGAYTNVNQVTPAWTAPATGTVDHYEYSYTSPTTSWSAPSAFNGTSIPDQAFGGAGNNGVQGPWQFKVRAVDQYGNMSAWVESPVMTYDRVAPTTPSITSPIEGAYFATSPILNQWSVSTDVLSGLAHYQIAYNYDDGHSFGSSTCAGLTMSGYNGFIGCRDLTATSRNHAPGIGEQGGVTIWVRAIDNAGNVSDWSAPVHYTYDATPPAVSITSVTVSNGVNKTATINGLATDANFNYYYCYVTGLGGEVGTRDSLCQTAWAAGTPFKTAFAPTVVGQPGGVIGLIDMSGLPTGTYTAHLVAKDKAGNQTESTGFTFDVDNTAPAAAITTTGTQATATPTISGTVDTDADSLVFTIDGIAQPLTWTSGDSTWTSTPVTDLADGVHNMSIVAKDLAGNIGGQTGTITISVPATVITPLIATPNPGQTPAPTPQATVTPGEVLGDQTTNTDSANKSTDSTNKQDTAVLGDTTGNGVVNWFGLAWYWWVLIVAAIIAAWWAIAAARRRNAEN